MHLLPISLQAKGPHVRTLWENGDVLDSTAIPTRPATCKRSTQLSQHIHFVEKFGGNPTNKKPALAYAKHHRLMHGTIFRDLLPRSYYSHHGFQKEAFFHIQVKQRQGLLKEQGALLPSRSRLASLEGVPAPAFAERSTQQRIQDLKIRIEKLRAKAEAELNQAQAPQSARNHNTPGQQVRGHLNESVRVRMPRPFSPQAERDALKVDLEERIRGARNFLQHPGS